MALQENKSTLDSLGAIRQPRRVVLLEAVVGAAAAVVGIPAIVALGEQGAKVEARSRRELFDVLFGRADAQDGANTPADTKPEAPKDAATGKKEGAEEEGDPKFPPVISWKVKVTIAKKDRVINLTRTEDGKRTKVEFEGYIKEDNPVFELPERLPVDTSEKEKAKLKTIVGAAIVAFYKKGTERGVSALIENGKIPMTAEPKTIDWEVVAEQNDDTYEGLIRRVRLVSDGRSTVVIFYDKGGGDVVRVRHELPPDMDPSKEINTIVLKRILFGARASLGPDGKDTFERRMALGEGAIEKPGLEPRFRIVKHSSKEVSTKTPDIKKE